jgi:hypothetical protein
MQVECPLTTALITNFSETAANDLCMLAFMDIKVALFGWD